VVSPTPGWPKLTQANVDETIEKFGKDSVRTITVDGQTYVRMTPYAELEKQFAEPGKFLMIPGYEQTGGCFNEQQVHMNFINVREVFPYIRAETPLEIFERTFAKGQEVYEGQDYLFLANHPLWRYYDYSPADLIALPQIRLFELNNNDVAGGLDAHPQGWKPEKFWDVVNAYRAAHDQPLLLGVGTDDRHSYDTAAKAWSVVRAAELRTKDLLEAMSAGDFYASNGLDFEDIQFDGKTLSVKIDVREQGQYRILFLGTKKDYDPVQPGCRNGKGPPQPGPEDRRLFGHDRRRPEDGRGTGRLVYPAGRRPVRPGQDRQGLRGTQARLAIPARRMDPAVPMTSGSAGVFQRGDFQSRRGSRAPIKKTLIFHLIFHLISFGSWGSRKRLGERLGEIK
jgi:hypothetical protein